MFIISNAEEYKTLYCSWLLGGWSWLVGVVDDMPDSMLCLTIFLVLCSTVCGYVCVYQYVGQSNTINEHTSILISATYFP